MKSKIKLLTELNKEAKKHYKSRRDLDKKCKELNGKEVTIPEGASYDLRKYVGRKGLLDSCSTDSFYGVVTGCIKIYQLRDPSKFLSCDASRSCFEITPDFFGEPTKIVTSKKVEERRLTKYEVIKNGNLDKRSLEPTRCIIKDGWHNAGKEGVVLGKLVEDHSGMLWVPILWDDEEDPDFHKERGIDFI